MNLGLPPPKKRRCSHHQLLPFASGIKHLTFGIKKGDDDDDDDDDAGGNAPLI